MWTKVSPHTVTFIGASRQFNAFSKMLARRTLTWEICKTMKVIVNLDPAEFQLQTVIQTDFTKIRNFRRLKI